MSPTLASVNGSVIFICMSWPQSRGGAVVPHPLRPGACAITLRGPTEVPMPPVPNPRKSLVSCLTSGESDDRSILILIC